MILTLQQGGGLAPLPTFTVTNPVSVDPFQQKKTTSDKTSKDKDELLEMYKYVKDLKLLPNDSAYIMGAIEELLEMRKSGYPINQKHIDGVWSKIMQALSPAKYHAEDHEKAIQIAENNKALSEIAITKGGQVVGMDETGKLKSLNIEEARSGQYRLLTNSEVADLNARNASFAFDTSLLKIVENGIGMEKVNELIKEASMSLGISEIQQAGYTLKMAQDVQAGLQIAAENAKGMPLQGLYKSKMIGKEQMQQVKLALDYIYTILPDNAKTLLKLQTGNEQTAKELIFKRLGAQLEPFSSFDTEYEELKGGKGSAGKDTLPDLTEVEKWLYGYGYKEQFDLVGGTSNAIRFDSTVLSMTDGGKPIGQTTLQKAIGGDFNGVLDTRSVTMGNQVIDTNALDKVILKDGRIYKVELPLNQELYRQGIIAPDYNYSKNKEKADAIIKERNITDKQQINDIYEDNNLPIKYDKNGNLITTHYATFGALHAIALDQAFVDEDSLAMTSYLKEIAEEREAKNALQIYKQLNGLSKDDETLKDWDYQDKPWNERSHNALYEGVLYIPVQANFANAKVGQGISPSEMDELHRMQVETDTAKQLKRTGWNDGK